MHSFAMTKQLNDVEESNKIITGKFIVRNAECEWARGSMRVLSVLLHSDGWSREHASVERVTTL